jgi:hypothetical protein
VTNDQLAVRLSFYSGLEDLDNKITSFYSKGLLENIMVFYEESLKLRAGEESRLGRFE